MTTTHPKVEKALNAMKALGIPRDTVMPVLKDLFRLYGRRWEFVEAENYRALADAIFEPKEDKGGVTKAKREKTPNDESSEPSCKKFCKRQGEEDKASGANECDIFSVSLDGGVKSLSRSQSKEKTVKPCSLPSPTVPLDKKHAKNTHAVLQIPQMAPSSTYPKTGLDGSSSAQERDEIPRATQVNGSSSIQEGDKIPRAKQANGSISMHDRIHIPRAKQTNGSSSTHEGNMIPRAKQNSEHHDFYSSPLKMMNAKRTVSAQPELPACIVIDSGSIRVDKGTEENGSVSKNSNGTCSNFNSGPSSSGNANPSIRCDSSLAKPNSHGLDRVTIMKFIEEKLPKIKDTIGDPSCRTKLLEEICDCFVELLSNSSQRVLAAKPSDVRNGVGKVVAIEQDKIVSLLQKKKPHYYIDDITKGEEKVKISLVDESGKGDRPSFYYIPKNLIYQNAHVNISLARISEDDCCSKCSGDCLSVQVPCACASETGGEFAYTPDGRLKEELLKTYISMNQEPQKHHLFYCKDCPVKVSKDEPCKGHLIRRFIKECWSKCGCDLHCGNRVVQRGISCSLQVFWADGKKGWGLRILEDLPVGAFVCEYVGEVLTNTELYERNLQNSKRSARHTYPVQLDADWGSESILEDEELLCLDATFYGNVARFINHRCYDSNLLEVPVEVETLDHHYYHLAFFTKREVKAFEELTWDYQIDFDDHDHPIKAFQCRCGSTFCRDKSRKAKGKAKASQAK